MNALPAALAQLPAGLVWRGAGLPGHPPAGRPSGFAALDALLPGGGWPRGALVELLSDRPGIGELSLLLPLMKAVETPRWLVWVAPPLVPYGPALATAGVPLERLLWVAPGSPRETRWATRQALASGSCAVVLAWLESADMAALRRLQLAAEQSGTPLFLFRPSRAAAQPSPAALRLQLGAGAAGQLQIRILKSRGPLRANPLVLTLAGRTGARASAFVPLAPPPRRHSRTHARCRPGLSAGVEAIPSHAVARPDPARTSSAGDPARVV